MSGVWSACSPRQSTAGPSAFPFCLTFWRLLSASLSRGFLISLTHNRGVLGVAVVLPRYPQCNGNISKQKKNRPPEMGALIKVFLELQRTRESLVFKETWWSRITSPRGHNFSLFARIQTWLHHSRCLSFSQRDEEQMKTSTDHHIIFSYFQAERRDSERSLLLTEFRRTEDDCRA